jgi:hypothetical protein
VWEGLHQFVFRKKFHKDAHLSCKGLSSPKIIITIHKIFFDKFFSVFFYFIFIILSPFHLLFYIILLTVFHILIILHFFNILNMSGRDCISLFFYEIVSESGRLFLYRTVCTQNHHHYSQTVYGPFFIQFFGNLSFPFLLFLSEIILFVTQFLFIALHFSYL